MSEIWVKKSGTKSFYRAAVVLVAAPDAASWHGPLSDNLGPAANYMIAQSCNGHTVKFTSLDYLLTTLVRLYYPLFDLDIGK